MLEHFLKTTFSVEGSSDYESVKRTLRHQNFPDREIKFKKDLSEAIKCSKFSIDKFENLTGFDYETQEEVNEFLIKEIWQPLYGDELIVA